MARARRAVRPMVVSDPPFEPIFGWGGADWAESRLFCVWKCSARGDAWEWRFYAWRLDGSGRPDDPGRHQRREQHADESDRLRPR